MYLRFCKETQQCGTLPSLASAQTTSSSIARMHILIMTPELLNLHGIRLAKAPFYTVYDVQFGKGRNPICPHNFRTAISIQYLLFKTMIAASLFGGASQMHPKKNRTSLSIFEMYVQKRKHALAKLFLSSFEIANSLSRENSSLFSKQTISIMILHKTYALISFISVASAG